MGKCKFFFKDLVYVDFEDEKIIGEIESHRITKDGLILYRVDGVQMFVPPTMVHELTKEQENKYNGLVSRYIGANDRDGFVRDMQEIFK